MQPIRIFFRKEGRAKYISHLDLNRVMQRALRRADIPVWRTQGFNPHPYIVFGLPLSLFYESDCEVMDARLDGDMSLSEVKKRLSEQMPEGIEITAVTRPEHKLTEICFASYHLSLEFDGMTKSELCDMLAKVMSNEQIIIEKKTKHNMKEIDVKKYFESADIEVLDGLIQIDVTVPAGPMENLNPAFFAAAFEKYVAKPDFENVRRLKLLTKDMNIFA